MDPTTDPAAVIGLFSGAAPSRRQLFLSVLIQHLSTSARGSYKHDANDHLQAHDDLRSFNEMIQIVSKQLSSEIRGADAPYDDTRFFGHLRENGRTPYSRVGLETALTSAMSQLVAAPPR